MTIKFKNRKTNYTDLTPNQSYVVIGIEANDYRILNDYGRPYLYPKDLFEIRRLKKYRKHGLFLLY